MPLQSDGQRGDTAPAAVFSLDGRPLATSQDVARFLGVNHAQMIYVLYKAPDDARYHCFEIPKSSGGMRQISAPHGLLRKMQDKLLPAFQQVYDAHPRAHGFIADRSVATNAKDHAGKRWVLNIDLVDFFPSINFGRVRGLFMKPPFAMASPAAAVVAQIAAHRNGLPQGAPTSPVLSNFIAATLDRRLHRLARQNKLVYSRYADDITFSTTRAQFPPAIALHEQLPGGGFKTIVGDLLEKEIALSGFAVNAKKVRIQGHGVQQSVTGLIVNHHVNVERERIRQIRAMLHAWGKFGLEAAASEHFRKYRFGKALIKAPKPSAFRNIVYGHLSFVRMVRGPEDPVFLKLCAKVLDVDPNPSKFIRQMVFGADDFDIFISHAREDKAEIGRPIYEACARAGLKAFLDEEHIGWGESFTKKINTALGAARTVVAIVSSHSVAKDWPILEVNTALALEISGNKRVVPVMVGNPDLSKLPLIRGKNWLVWRGDPDQIARELKAVVKPAPPPPPKKEPSAAVPGVAQGTQSRASSAALASSTDGPWDKAVPTAVKPKRGLLSRLFGRKPSR